MKKFKLLLFLIENTSLTPLLFSEKAVAKCSAVDTLISFPVSERKKELSHKSLSREMPVDVTLLE